MCQSLVRAEKSWMGPTILKRGAASSNGREKVMRSAFVSCRRVAMVDEEKGVEKPDSAVDTRSNKG